MNRALDMVASSGSGTNGRGEDDRHFRLMMKGLMTHDKEPNEQRILRGRIN